MGHFYTQDGQCIDGLRAARRLNPLPLPSPTTVLSLIKGEGLIEYFKRQMFEATATTPRRPEWSDDDYYAAVKAWSDEHSKAARTRGGDLHDLIQAFHVAVRYSKPMPEIPAQLAPQYGAYVDWYADNVAKSRAVEEVVVGDGYAGRVDHVAKLNDGRVAVLDVKSQDISKRKSFNHYTSWALQLGAYAGAWEGGADGRKVDVLMSICISTGPNPVVLEAYEWERPPHFYARLFRGLLEIWSLENSYWPTRTVEEAIA